MIPAFRPGVRVRRCGAKLTGSIYQLDHDGHAYVKWDDGQFVRERVDEITVASVVDELAAIEAGDIKLTGRQPCDPQVLHALLAELHRVPDGHQHEVLSDMENISTTTARCLLSALRDYRMKLDRARSRPWRIV